jgi:hypothetical protein
VKKKVSNYDIKCPNHEDGVNGLKAFVPILTEKALHHQEED